MKQRNEVLALGFEFALMIIAYAEALEKNKKYVIGRQLLKSGTSIGANIREAQSCESELDFIHKLKIAHKEALETEYWLDLCLHASSYPNPEGAFKDKLLSIQKLLNKIISTIRSNIKTS